MKKNAVSKFDALSDEEKERIYNEIDSESFEDRLARSRPLNARERARFEAFRTAQLAKRKAGRPRIGKGAKPIAVTIEKGLLKRADAYAKAHGMKRAELIARGILRMIKEDEPRDAA